MKTLNRSRSRKRKVGFSLIELLVAMAVTLVVLGAALMMFVKSTDTNDTTQQLAEAQANARAAANLLAQDLSQAGTQVSWGGIQLPSGAGATNSVFATDASGANYLVPNAYFTSSNITMMYGVTPAPAAGPTIGTQAMDGINMVYADPILDSTDTTISNWPLVTMATTPAAGQGTITTTGGVTVITFPAGMKPAVNDPNTGLQIGDVLLLSNTTGQAVGMVTAVNSPTSVSMGPGDPFVLNQSGFPGTVPALASGIDGSGNPIYNNISVMKLAVITYFLQPLDSNGAPLAVGAAGAVDYRLMRQVNALTPTIVAEHIDYFRFFYDLADTSCTPPVGAAGMSHTPDGKEPASCGGGTAYDKIRTIYISLAARAARPDRRGQYLHATINTAIGPRSLSYHNTYPAT